MFAFLTRYSDDDDDDAAAAVVVIVCEIKFIQKQTREKRERERVVKHVSASADKTTS